MNTEWKSSTFEDAYYHAYKGRIYMDGQLFPNTRIDAGRVPDVTEENQRY